MNRAAGMPDMDATSRFRADDEYGLSPQDARGEGKPAYFTLNQQQMNQ
jgi:hypothetical protein